MEDPPNRYEEDFLTECNEEPTQDWQRRWNVGMILRHNVRHPEDPTPLPQWITESPDNYATLKRPKSRCRNQKQTEFIYMTETTDVTIGMNQLSMIQINYPSKSKSQTLKLNLWRLQTYHHRRHRS